MRSAVAKAYDGIAEKVNTALDGMSGSMGHARPESNGPWLVFLIGNTRYAMNAHYIAHVSALCEIVPVMNAPAYYPGVTWDHGDLVHLLDLRRLFGQEDYLSAIKKEENRLPIIIVVWLYGKKHGMIVDGIIGLEYFHSVDELLPEQIKYVRGAAEGAYPGARTLIIGPESFGTLKFEGTDMGIDWKGRMDMKLKIDSL